MGKVLTGKGTSKVIIPNLGCLGLNNLGHTDGFNVVLHSLFRIPQLRAFFLRYEDPQGATDADKQKRIVTRRLSELFRKVWNPINFKNHVSPHEFLQAVTQKSAKRFSIGQRIDPVQFFAWLLNTLHDELKSAAGKCSLGLTKQSYSTLFKASSM